MWWNTMSVLQQVMFIIACAATGVLLFQIITMLIGGASDGSFDGDVSGGGGVFDADVPDADFGGGGGMLDTDMGGSLDSGLGGALDTGVGDITSNGGGSDITDNDVSTGSGFGLKLLSLRSILAFVTIGAWMCYTLCYMLDWYYAVIIAVVCGFAAACGMAGALIGIEKMQDNGTLNANNAVGKIGTVYLTVPPHRSGQGKINVLVQERYAEYEAVTDSDEPIPTGSEIKVLGHIGANVLLVTKYKKPSIVIETEK